MAALALKHLWSDVVWRTANGALFFTVEIEFGGQTKVTQLDLHLVVEEEVAELQVAVDDPVRVQVLQSVYYLHCVALHFELMESFSALEQLVHRLILAEFQQDVHILAVFEKVLEVAHVRVLDTAMDLDLAHELLLGSTLGQRRLLDDLGGVDEVGVCVDEFEALSEAAFPQELALDVAPDADVPALLLEFLLNQRLLLCRRLTCLLTVLAR